MYIRMCQRGLKIIYTLPPPSSRILRILRIGMSHVAHVKESCRAYERVMSRIQLSRVTGASYDGIRRRTSSRYAYTYKYIYMNIYIMYICIYVYTYTCIHTYTICRITCCGYEYAYHENRYICTLYIYAYIYIFIYMCVYICIHHGSRLKTCSRYEDIYMHVYVRA